ncbi:MAG: ATP-binding protein [Tissierellaceae bacterium]
MLIRFQLENFLSFNQKQNFSMIASNLKNKNKHVFEKNKVRLLNMSAIYGANASGKTNIVKAIDLFRFITTKKVPTDISKMYFRENSENEQKPTIFEVEFIKNGSIYAFGIQLSLNNQKILSEWLYKLFPNNDDEEMIYERELVDEEYTVKYNEHTIIGEDESRLRFVIADMKTNTTTLLLSEMNRNKNIDIDSSLYFFEEIYDWFQNDLKIYFPNDHITKFDYIIGKNKSGNKELNHIISLFDTGISSVSLERISKDELGEVFPKHILEDIINDMRQIEIKSKKRPRSNSVLRSQNDFFQISNITNDNYDVETIKLRHGFNKTTYDFREESDGTRRLFDLLDILLNSDTNKIFIVDELDRSLHPNLTYKFVELFYEVALEKNIQLIFTTHESKIMDLNLVRQDEIWFVEKNRMNESELYSLDSFKERYDKRIEKAYLEGRYGAIPLFNSFESFINRESED